MMSIEEFNRFLKERGGLINPKGPLPHPISLFGIECDDGWLEMIAQLIHELIDAGWTREIRQIKEKFGGLRFYADGLNNQCAEIIIKYEKRSYQICERCGSTYQVELRGHGWVKTLCEQCAGPWLNRHARAEK
jgi:hypothetical protein